jgi:hypothetical protein
MKKSCTRLIEDCMIDRIMLSHGELIHKAQPGAHFDATWCLECGLCYWLVDDDTIKKYKARSFFGIFTLGILGFLDYYFLPSWKMCYLVAFACICYGVARHV